MIKTIGDPPPLAFFLVCVSLGLIPRIRSAELLEKEGEDITFFICNPGRLC